MSIRALPFAAALLLLVACGYRRPEDRIRAAFEGCRAAVEAGDANRAAAPLAADFRGPEGMDRATARLFLAATLRRERVGVTVLNDAIRVEGREAFQEVDLVLTGRAGGLLPEETSRRQFLLHWREEGGAWKLAEIQSPGEP